MIVTNTLENAVDHEPIAQGAKLIRATPAPAAPVSASCNRDFVSSAGIAYEMKWTVTMAELSGAISAKRKMGTTVDLIRPVDEVFDKISVWVRSQFS
jgi:hypothetical protein